MIDDAAQLVMILGALACVLLAVAWVILLCPRLGVWLETKLFK